VAVAAGDPVVGGAEDDVVQPASATPATNASAAARLPELGVMIVPSDPF
jgi:hypothetical protein